jgi:hypothetical protein
MVTTAITSMSMKEMKERTREQQQIGQQPDDVSPVFAQDIECADKQDRRAKQ